MGRINSFFSPQVMFRSMSRWSCKSFLRWTPTTALTQSPALTLSSRAMCSVQTTSTFPIARVEDNQFTVDYVSAEEAAALLPHNEILRTREYPHGYFEAPVLNWQREVTGTYAMPSAIFGEVLRADIIHRCLIARMAQRRNLDGIKASKTVSDISGSGLKPRPQKGSGRARLGKKRAAQILGGEKAHGRVARDVSIDLPHQVLRMGMRSALSAKYALGEIVLIDNLDIDSAKTKDFAHILREGEWGDRVIFLDTSVSQELRTSSHAVPRVYVSTIYRANIWDLLRKKFVVVTPRAVEEMVRLYHPSESVRKANKSSEEGTPF